MLEKSTTSVFMHAHKYKSTILQLFTTFINYKNKSRDTAYFFYKGYPPI